MRKLNVSSQALKALYPPMSEAFHYTVANTLHRLAQGKEQPVMKKKISAALIVAMILILLTISAAVALTQKDLLTFMFGQEQPPKEVEELVNKPEATTLTPDIKVTLSEYLYDGEKLYLHWTLTNQAGRQLMVTMDTIRINRQKVNIEQNTPFPTEFDEFGKILGGEVEGVTMPQSVHFYDTYINPDWGMRGYYTFRSGAKMEITCNLSVWELLNPPELIYDDEQPMEKEYLEAPRSKGMPTFQNGTCGLGWVEDLDRNLDIYNKEKNRRTYEANNWAKLLYEQPIQVSVTLDDSPLKKTKPQKFSFSTNDFSLQIERMDYMSTGGTLVLRVVPKVQGVTEKEFVMSGNDFAVLDADSKEVVSKNTVFTQVSGREPGIQYTIALKSVSGSMPKAILIVPAAYNPAWNKDAANIYPPASSLDSKDSYYIFQMENAVRVELK